LIKKLPQALLTLLARQKYEFIRTYANIFSNNRKIFTTIVRS